MNVSLMNDDNVYFQNFIFNPKLRTLSCGESTYQLRKKEADVLALLCDRYPHPVSQDDFLSCVWEGGYVTPQSIAQVIRSLRRNLQDKDKQIIVTIPKLGYRLGPCPTYDEPATHAPLTLLSAEGGESTFGARNDTGCGRFEYDHTSLINLTPISVNSLAISPYVRPKKKSLRIKNIFIVVLFILIIYILWYISKTPFFPFRHGVENEQQPTHHTGWATEN